MPEKDYLWLNLRALPYFRSLLRAVEARFYRSIDLPAPTLDVGCGDGHFASVAFDRPLEVGLDPWGIPIREAASWGGYQSLVQADGGLIPFPSASFASAVSNSVLEHIPHVELVLCEVSRVLKPGAPFVFCVPNHLFLNSLSVGRAFERMGLHPLASSYRSFFNRISRHIHCEPPEAWQARLDLAGFDLEQWWHYFSSQALCVVEWGHYFGLPSLASRKLTGRWVLAPTRWNLAPIYRYLKPFYEEGPEHADGVYSFYIARRR